MFRIFGLALVIVLVLGAGAHAATLLTGAVLAGPGNLSTCTALNVKTSSIAEIRVEVVPLGSMGQVIGGGGATTCSDLVPENVCLRSLTAGTGTVAVSCRIELSTGKQAVRGVLCNATTGACSEAQ